MLETYVEELAEDRNKIWDAMCDSNHPGFWGFVTGWCTTAGLWLLVSYIITIFGGKKES